MIQVYSYVTQNLVNPRLGGFGSNALNEHDPKHWFWKDDRMLALQRQRLERGVETGRAPGPRRGKFSPQMQRTLEEMSRRRREALQRRQGAQEDAR